MPTHCVKPNIIKENFAHSLTEINYVFTSLQSGGSQVFWNKIQKIIIYYILHAALATSTQISLINDKE